MTYLSILMAMGAHIPPAGAMMTVGQDDIDGYGRVDADVE
jgi:hypothetical protein